MSVTTTAFKKEKQSKKAAVNLFNYSNYFTPDIEEVVEKYDTTIRKVASKFKSIPHSLEFEDLVQAGYLGAIRAIQTYTPQKAKYTLCSFRTYLMHHIKWAIKNEITSNDRSGGVRFMSIDTPVGNEDEGVMLSDVLPASNNHSPFDAVVNAEVWRYVDALPEKQRKVIILRYKHGKTLQSIGDELKITKERVRQIESSAIAALKRKMTRGGKHAANI